MERQQHEGAIAPCGFLSPAGDSLDKPLDFNELLVETQSAMFAVRIAGASHQRNLSVCQIVDPADNTQLTLRDQPR